MFPDDDSLEMISTPQLSESIVKQSANNSRSLWKLSSKEIESSSDYHASLLSVLSISFQLPFSFPFSIPFPIFLFHCPFPLLFSLSIPTSPSLLIFHSPFSLSFPLPLSPFSFLLSRPSLLLRLLSAFFFVLKGRFNVFICAKLN